MARPPEEIRSALASLLAKGHKRKDKVLGRFAVLGFLLGISACGNTQVLLSQEAGWGDTTAFFAGLVVGFVVLGLVMYVDDLLNNRRSRKIAKTFRKEFSKESGDYAKAVTLLHKAKTKHKIEKDLLKALDIDPEFDAGPGNGVWSKSVGVITVSKQSSQSGAAAPFPGITATQSKDGLLGNLAANETYEGPVPAAASAQPSSGSDVAAPEFMPLDPYDAAGGGGETDGKH